MAISPQHLVQLFTEEVDKFEQEIDKLLSTQKIYKGQTISVTAPKGLNLTHYQILKSRYIAAGWTDVQYNSDQRDGEWLNFKY